MHDDIHDNEKDQQHLQSDEATFELPEVKDIPGQENVRPPQLNEFADTTASSDDEEGKGVVDFEDEDANETTDDSNVSKEENELLQRTVNSMSSEDDEDRRNATLDNVDDDGELLNELNDVSGKDLDVPGSEIDDDDEELGEEDEENNSYSLGGDRKD